MRILLQWSMASIRTGSIVLAAVALGACGQDETPAQPPPPQVAVQTVAQEPVPLDLTYAARTAGSREVEVRARVGGILLKRRFEEGSRVKEGQPMFLIDPEPVRARLSSARAELAVAKARLEEARRQKDRVLALAAQNVVSQSQRDEVVSAFEVGQANVEAAESRVRTAQLDLGYTDVRAPISGLTSREMLSEGSLIATDSNSSLLTRIVQVDPLYIEFAVPDSEAALMRPGLAQSGEPAPRVKLILENGEEFAQTARINFIDNAVDQNSGTVLVRAVLPNAEARLLPGQFIRARVEGVSLNNVVSIPRKALMTSAQGPYVWLVGAEEKIEMRPVEIGRSMGNSIIVTRGLAPGDRYVVEGVMKVRPGVQVSAVSLEPPARQAEAESKPVAQERSAHSEAGGPA